jgi:branched-chain amino acid transport system permease protein
MELLITTLVAGICIGAIYGFIGLSFTAIFNSSQVINFAQGDLGMLGAFAGYLFVFSGLLPVWLGIIAVLGVTVLAGVLINSFFAEPLVQRKAPVISPILATLGASLILTGIVGAYTDFSYFKTSFIFGSDPIDFGLFKMSTQYLAIIVVLLSLSFSYWLLLNKSNLGLAFKAVGIDDDMASLVGIKLRRIRLLAWCISSLISGVAGFLIAPLILPSALMGLHLVVNGFIAAVFGGFGNPLAAVLGGLILGLLIQLFTGYISAGHGELLVFIALIVVLAFRPHGLLGEET